MCRLYKRLESGSFQWPRNGEGARQLTPQQQRWLVSMFFALDRSLTTTFPDVPADSPCYAHVDRPAHGCPQRRNSRKG